MLRLSPRHLLLRTLLATICCLSGAHASGHEVTQHCASDDAQTTEVSSADDGVVEDLPLQGGGFQRVLYCAARRDPKGIIVMFPGGTGEIDIEKSGRVKNAKNFVVR